MGTSMTPANWQPASATIHSGELSESMRRAVAAPHAERVEAERDARGRGAEARSDEIECHAPSRL